MRPRRWRLAAGVLILAAALAGIRQLDAHLILYPTSASLPKGLCFRTFGALEIVKISTFPMPEVARRYQVQRRNKVPDGFLLMKPIVASPGDHICNGETGLFINGTRIADTARHDGTALRSIRGFERALTV